jgi:predicted metal-dependent peptidase
MNNKKDSLESALYSLVLEQPFYGGLLQELNIIYTQAIPTAAIIYSKRQDQIQLHLNADFFCNMPVEQRKAILQHEVLHFTHQHIWRYMEKKTEDGSDQKLFNIAADMAINQYIQGLPKGGIDIKNFKQKDGSAFPSFKSMEFYWELLQELDGNKAKKEAEKNGSRTPNQDELDKYFKSPFDEHNWEELSDDDKQKLLQEAQKVIKRTIDKSQFGHTNIPGSIKDLLEKLDNQISGINYKQILRNIIKRTICGTDRENTWNRPSKRYGNFAPGTKVGFIPRILFMVDTSGSISHTELCEFFKTVDGFLKLGQKVCRVGFWHTELYKVKKYKNFKDIGQDDIESGGTCPLNAIKYAEEKNSDLTIFLTDGFFDTNIKTKLQNILWVISKNGNKSTNDLNNLPGKHTKIV